MDFKFLFMKKLLLFLLIPGSILAQGNLQFNQVINTSVTASAGYDPEYNGTLVGTITVPSGKVIKLESASVYLNNSSGDIRWYYSTGSSNIGSKGCWIGDHLVWAPYWFTSGGSLNKVVDTANFPIWYGPGDYQIRVRHRTYFMDANYVVAYSGIEFNVVN